VPGTLSAAGGPVTGGPGRGTPGLTASGPAVRSPATTPPVLVGPAASTPSTAAVRTAQRLTATLRSVVTPPPGGRLSGGIAPGLNPLEFVPSQGGYKAAADVTDPLGTGHLLVWLDLPQAKVAGDPCVDLIGCAYWTSASGYRVVTTVDRSGEAETYQVTVTRPDGRGTLVSASNFSLATTAQKALPRAERSVPPWTMPALVSIALAPDLTFS
jgi:hypothetical protein